MNSTITAPGTRVKVAGYGVTGVVVPLEGDALFALEVVEASLAGTRFDRPRSPTIVAIRRDDKPPPGHRYQFAEPDDLTVTLTKPERPRGLPGRLAATNQHTER